MTNIDNFNLKDELIKALEENKTSLDIRTNNELSFIKTLSPKQKIQFDNIIRERIYEQNQQVNQTITFVIGEISKIFKSNNQIYFD